MSSILNTPANKIPLHLFCLPIAQREVLLVNVLTNPILYERIIASALYHNDPIFPQAVKDASLSQVYSFLPASWVGDTHEETDFLPIGDREAKERDDV